ncbi:zinc finger protein 99-like [Phthorimaea operculella]|nr:zinc finger protein 99-like [Phthorimaea operculella]
MNAHYKNFICALCGAGYISSSRLRIHSRTHEAGSHPCKVCNKVFLNAHARDAHNERVHSNVKRHKCPLCSETFKSYSLKKKHLSAAHEIKVSEFKCDMCPKIFLMIADLNRHKRNEHMKERNYQCKDCELSFFDNYQLKLHSVKHGGERIYRCDVCKKSYARPKTLREHMRIHNNDRRFVCDVCGKAFVQNCTLKDHAKTHKKVKTQ